MGWMCPGKGWGGWWGEGCAQPSPWSALKTLLPTSAAFLGTARKSIRAAYGFNSTARGSRGLTGLINGHPKNTFSLRL